MISYKNDEVCGRKNETYGFIKDGIFRPPGKLPTVQENLELWLVG